MITPLFIGYFMLTLSTLQTQPASGGRPPAYTLSNAFFAMNTSTKDANHETIEAQLRMVKELGFAGWSCHLPDGSEETLALVDSLGLKLFTVYTGVDIDGKQPPWNPALPDTIRRLKGRDTQVWLIVTGTQYPAGSKAGDERAVEIVRRVADMAAESGVSVSLYPHNGNYIAGVRDALRILRNADRRNLSVTFNLCHWLKVDHGQDLDAILREAMPHLSFVSINGADNGGTDWDQLIQPLGQGTYDVYDLLLRLKGFGYRGPIGLQGYGIQGDMHQHLTQAMQTWSEYRRRLDRSSRMSDRTYQVKYVSAAGIDLDGRADESAWEKASAESRFVFPWKKGPVPPTEFRALCDDENFYFMFRVQDADIVVLDNLRNKEDAALEDRAEIFLSRDEAMKDYYCVEIDSRGRAYDYRGSFYRQLDPRWSLPGLHVKAAPLPQGYVIEGRIPLKSLEALGLPYLRPGVRVRGGLYRAEFSHDRSGKPAAQTESIHTRGRRLEGPSPVEEWMSWIDPETREPDFHVPSSLGWLEVIR